ncbi:hypothetical protein HDU93_001944 [Gonapodya sp. JEL0774]|nr:hypothetical protein HDU93_001944 [Gonapodya sp. JEL0774]
MSLASATSVAPLRLTPFAHDRLDAKSEQNPLPAKTAPSESPSTLEIHTRPASLIYPVRPSSQLDHESSLISALSVHPSKFKVDVLSKAIAAGANPNATTNLNFTLPGTDGTEHPATLLAPSPLALAILHGNLGAVASLLNAGADPQLPIVWEVPFRHGWSNEQMVTGAWKVTYRFPAATLFALVRGCEVLETDGSLAAGWTQDSNMRGVVRLPSRASVVGAPGSDGKIVVLPRTIEPQMDIFYALQRWILERVARDAVDSYRLQQDKSGGQLQKVPESHPARYAVFGGIPR